VRQPGFDPPTLVLVADAEDRYFLNGPGIKDEAIGSYFKLENGRLVIYKPSGESEGALADAIELTDWVTVERKFTPFLSPEILGPP
jgi:hypothetical protein